MKTALLKIFMVLYISLVTFVSFFEAKVIKRLPVLGLFISRFIGLCCFMKTAILKIFMVLYISLVTFVSFFEAKVIKRLPVLVLFISRFIGLCC